MRITDQLQAQEVADYLRGDNGEEIRRNELDEMK